MIENRYIKTMIMVIMVIYVMLLGYVFFIDSFKVMTLNEYINTSTNFVPLKSIMSYLHLLINGDISLIEIFFNLFCNIILYIPFGFVLPIINLELLKQHRLYKLMFTLIIIASLIQIILKIGFFDIDNVILQMIGVMIGYHFLITKKGYVM